MQRTFFAQIGLTLLVFASIGVAARAADGSATLANGQVTYAPPDGWERGTSGKPDVHVYVTTAHDGILSIEVPPDMKDVGPNTGAHAIVELRKRRQQGHQRIVMDPKVEPDDRFALRIRERYEIKGADGTPAVLEQLHLYRKVGRFIVMATVNAVATDEQQVKQIQQAGETALLSAAVASASGKK